MDTEFQIRDVASEYVGAVVAKHEVNAAAVRAAEGLFPLLEEWAGRSPFAIELSGSHAKGTATALGTDVDILVSLSESSGQNIKDIYWRMFHWLGHRGLRPKAGDVSLRVERDGMAVDVVPGHIRGRGICGADGRNGGVDATRQGSPHTLYWRKKDGWVQTNVAEHTRIVRASGRTREIRALKIWRERQRLQLSSFYLELTVIESLKARFSKGARSAACGESLAVNVRRVLHYLADDFIRARVVDPANSHNVISDDYGAEEKRVIATAARKTLSKLGCLGGKPRLEQHETCDPQTAICRKWESVLW